MKSRILGAILFALLAASMYGQTLMRVNIPFDFRAGTANLAAGQYDVVRHASPGAWLIRPTTVKPGVILLASHGVLASTPAQTGKLVFHRYGEVYFLARIHIQGTDLGWEFAPSVLDRELRRGERGPFDA